MQPRCPYIWLECDQNPYAYIKKISFAAFVLLMICWSFRICFLGLFQPHEVNFSFEYPQILVHFAVLSPYAPWWTCLSLCQSWTPQGIVVLRFLCGIGKSRICILYLYKLLSLMVAEGFICIMILYKLMSLMVAACYLPKYVLDVAQARVHIHTQQVVQGAYNRYFAPIVSTKSFWFSWKCHLCHMFAILSLPAWWWICTSLCQHRISQGGVIFRFLSWIRKDLIRILSLNKLMSLIVAEGLISLVENGIKSDVRSNLSLVTQSAYLNCASNDIKLNYYIMFQKLWAKKRVRTQKAPSIGRFSLCQITNTSHTKRRLRCSHPFLCIQLSLARNKMHWKMKVMD